jgi:hypothetical protein
MSVYSGRGIGKYLVDEGLIPPNTRNVELHIPTDGAVFIRYEVFVTEDETQKLQRALARLHEDEKEFASSRVLR